MRIESENQLQVTKFITVNQKDANGNWFQRPMNMQQFKSAYQNDKNMLDAPINEYIDGTTYWEVEIEPKTRVFYTIFPLYKVDTAATLKGREHFVYALGKSSSFFEAKEEKLVVIFNNALVVKVIHSKE